MSRRERTNGVLAACAVVMSGGAFGVLAGTGPILSIPADDAMRADPPTPRDARLAAMFQSFDATPTPGAVSLVAVAGVMAVSRRRG